MYIYIYTCVYAYIYMCVFTYIYMYGTGYSILAQKNTFQGTCGGVFI